ncbi:MAG: hypothetical protein PQJ44_05035 [Sphaerochaetaceae bacterium]|nr:hypothetical protein [Sphaerochaetaceae bacterium]
MGNLSALIIMTIKSGYNKACSLIKPNDNQNIEQAQHTEITYNQLTYNVVKATILGGLT